MFFHNYTYTSNTIKFIFVFSRQFLMNFSKIVASTLAWKAMHLLSNTFYVELIITMLSSTLSSAHPNGCTTLKLECKCILRLK